ncbi:hypothetical protein [Massilia sp. Root335]|nr:hypothetical protein [Massilia sp. Root335]
MKILYEDGYALLATLTDPRKRDRLVVHMTRAAGASQNSLPP